MVFPGGSLCNVHAASLSLQVLVERLIEDDAVDQAAAHKQMCVFSMNLQRDILPLRVRQVHILERNHVLRAVQPVRQVQTVASSVGHNLKLSPAIGTLQADQGSPRGAVLPYAGRKHKAFIVLDLSQYLFQDRAAHWGQVVEADETVCRDVGVLASELFGPQSLAGDVADFKQVK